MSPFTKKMSMMVILTVRVMELYRVLLYFVSQSTYFVCPSVIIDITSRASISMTVTAPMRDMLGFQTKRSMHLKV